MNILGVGGSELIIIFVIMLLIAGPKRMIKWAYIMGQYVAKFRQMWAETVDVLQHEFDEAGVDIKVPRELPTRGSLNKQAAQALGSVTAPVKETLDQVNENVSTIKETTSSAAPDCQFDRAWHERAHHTETCNQCEASTSYSN